jgi:Yersinia/Haemophilus virulence surface antigen
MSVKIKISPTESYRFSLSHIKHETAYSRPYLIFSRIVSFLKSGLLAVWSFFDKTFSKIDCGINALPLRCAKIQSCGLSAINHAYKDAPYEQKKALEEYIYDKLAIKCPNFTSKQNHVLAHKIASDHKIYDIGGLCLGYSWLFAAYVLSHKELLQNAATLKDRFMQDETTRACPIISFASYVNFDELIQQKGSETIVFGEALRQDRGSLENEKEAICALREFAYPSLKLENGPSSLSIKDLIVEHRAYLSGIQSQTLSDFLEARNTISHMKRRYDHIMDAQKCLEAKDLATQILSHGKYFDKKALVFSVPTQDPTTAHAMCIYASQEEKNFIFFDPNLGVTSFPTLEDLAKGVSSYSESMYGAKIANYFDAISL